jgi:hypothetical protein
MVLSDGDHLSFPSSASGELRNSNEFSLIAMSDSTSRGKNGIFVASTPEPAARSVLPLRHTV